MGIHVMNLCMLATPFDLLCVTVTPLMLQVTDRSTDRSTCSSSAKASSVRGRAVREHKTWAARERLRALVHRFDGRLRVRRWHRRRRVEQPEHMLVAVRLRGCAPAARHVGSGQAPPRVASCRLVLSLYRGGHASRHACVSKPIESPRDREALHGRRPRQPARGGARTILL